MTTSRVHNFNAGPAGLPLPVLERAQRELTNYEGSGMSIMEHSHRGAVYDAVHNEAIQLLTDLLSIPDTHQVLFMQGGASTQFALLPLNLIQEGQKAAYAITGAWSTKAHGEANKVRPDSAVVAATSEKDGKHTSVPSADELSVPDGAAYLHLTSNNTIAGTQWHSFPEASAPLVVDMSSDFLWRKHDVSKFGVMYAGAQKNVGPSGLAILVMKKSLIEGARTDLPNIFRYSVHAGKNSLFHTPNTFGIYMVRNVLAHLVERGGLEAVEKANRDKAGLLYQTIDADADFFRCPVEESSRSVMNVVFNLPDADLEKRFVAEAAEAGLVGLKGHRSVGGIRASIYNACPHASVEALTDFMKKFRASA